VAGLEHESDGAVAAAGETMMCGPGMHNMAFGVSFVRADTRQVLWPSPSLTRSPRDEDFRFLNNEGVLRSSLNSC
jgi:hypothetical protein